MRRELPPFSALRADAVEVAGASLGTLYLRTIADRVLVTAARDFVESIVNDILAYSGGLVGVELEP